jgi:phage baseplate assembly protein W
MTYPPNRAWRFLHPDLDADGIGLTTDHTGRIALATEAESIRQSLLILFTTAPGERAMRASYGCDLFRLTFAPNDDTTAGLAIHHVRKAIERWEPRVDLLTIDASRGDSEAAELRIDLQYRIRDSGQRVSLSYGFPLNGEMPGETAQ